jgi:hypothetical protein
VEPEEIDMTKTVEEKPQVRDWVWLEPVEGGERKRVRLIRRGDTPWFWLVDDVDAKVRLYVHQSRLTRADA